MGGHARGCRVCEGRLGCFVAPAAPARLAMTMLPGMRAANPAFSLLLTPDP